jgi:hypothetical protein
MTSIPDLAPRVGTGDPTATKANPRYRPDNHLAAAIDAVDLELLLGEINTDRGNLHDGRLPSLWRFATTTLWHIDAGSGGRQPHQDICIKPRPLTGLGFSDADF